MNRKVVVPTQDTISSDSVSTPITSSGNPIDTATPTCLIGPKLAELFLRLCLRGASLIPPPWRLSGWYDASSIPAASTGLSRKKLLPLGVVAEPTEVDVDARLIAGALGVV